MRRTVQWAAVATLASAISVALAFGVHAGSRPAQPSVRAQRDNDTPPSSSSQSVSTQAIFAELQRLQAATTMSPPLPKEVHEATAQPSHEEHISMLDQRFSATPLDPSLQIENDRALRTIFKRLNALSALDRYGMECRGPYCRALVEFSSLEETRAVLNQLPKDPDWNRLGFGFNAIAEDSDDPEAQRFVLYFSRAVHDGAD